MHHLILPRSLVPHHPTRNLKDAKYLVVSVMKPKKMHDWTPRKRSRALALFEGGKHNVHEISFLTGIPKSTVSEIGTLGTPTSKPKMGRPKLLTARDKRRINMYIKKSSTTQQKDPD